MFSNISTKTKLMVLPLLFILIAVASGTVYTYYNGIVKTKSTNAKITREMTEQLLVSRIFVYQFFNEPINSRFQKVTNEFNLLDNQANTLLKNLKLSQDITTVNRVKKDVKNYLEMFKTVAANKKEDYINGINKESEETKQLMSSMTQTGVSLQKNIEKVTDHAIVQMTQAQKSQTTALLVIGVIATVLFIVIALALIRNILSNLSNFQNGLISFFSYLNNETSNVELLNDKNQDEFGQMATVVNQNIEKTKNNIDQDRKVIEESVKILTEYEQGDFSSKINLSSSNQTLNDLTKMINHMSANLEKNIDLILKVLNEYSDSNYMNKVSTNGIKAHLAQLATGVNTLGDSISQLLKRSLEIGLTLDNSSDILIENVDILNDSANSAAASLEETAAALEEITSTIVSNGQNIQQMNQYTDDLNSSAKQGQQLAQKTTTAMEDIDEQVSSINEAITVIDQIAFQTNILSLNAAVEAATAGEAGKGFAVVAAEVRNLASRSAEAAKEIKDLVENATAKANEGKNISAEMILGYNSLLENISNSTEKINEISTASKEQETGITQINDAINSLDKQTQENAATANRTQDIALDTDKIAKEIVADARSKEFIGKDSVSAQKKQTESRATVVPRQTPNAATSKNEQRNSNTKVQKQEFKSSSNDEDEWESF